MSENKFGTYDGTILGDVAEDAAQSASASDGESGLDEEASGVRKRKRPMNVTYV